MQLQIVKKSQHARGRGVGPEIDVAAYASNIVMVSAHKRYGPTPVPVADLEGGRAVSPPLPIRWRGSRNLTMQSRATVLTDTVLTVLTVLRRVVCIA